MNLCFFIGKICSEIQFEFILNSKNISIAIFDIELTNGSIIKVKSYNETARLKRCSPSLLWAEASKPHTESSNVANINIFLFIVIKAIISDKDSDFAWFTQKRNGYCEHKIVTEAHLLHCPNQ